MSNADAGTSARLWTVGHSNVPIDHLLKILGNADIDVVADVRTVPRSGYANWFDREELRASLASSGIDYVFLGGPLGGRPTSGDLYDDDGHVRYDLVAKSDDFRSGFERLLRGAAERRVAMMCSEEDPTGCHRRLLIARVAEDAGVEVLHLRGDGSVISETELTDQERSDQLGLFGEEDPRPWRSIRSVSPNGPPKDSSSD